MMCGMSFWAFRNPTTPVVFYSHTKQQTLSFLLVTHPSRRNELMIIMTFTDYMLHGFDEHLTASINGDALIIALDSNDIPEVGMR